MADSKLRKLALTVFKDKTVSDAAQIPASGVNITFHKRGVIADRVHSGATLAAGAGRTLNVRDSKGLEINDVLQKTTDATITATVTAKPSDASATVTVAGGTMTLAANDRLVITGPAGRVPTIYTDPLKVTSTATLTTDSIGYAQAYIAERQCDVLIGMSSGGITPQLRECETTGDDEYWINAANYATPQAAIDACPSVLGNRVGTVFFPAGLYRITSTITVDKSVRIIGDGRGSTVFYWFSGTSDKNIDCFDVQTSNVTIENLSIQMVGTAEVGTGRGIVWGDSGNLTGLTLRDITITNPPSWGIKYTGAESGNGYNSHSLIEKVDVFRARSNGAVDLGKDNFVISLINCDFSQYDGGVGPCLQGLNQTTFVSMNCEFAPALNTDAVYLTIAGNGRGDDGAGGVSIIGADIEYPAAATTSGVGIKVIDGVGVNISGCYILNMDKGITLEDVEGAVISGNLHRDNTTIDIGLTDCRDVVILNDRAVTGSTTETYRNLKVSESGTVTGTMMMVNGVVQLPRFATGSLPAAAANQVLSGSIAFDTTTNTVKFINNGGTWGSI